MPTKLKLIAGAAAVALSCLIGYWAGSNAQKAIYEPKLRQVAEFATEQAKTIDKQRKAFDDAQKENQEALEDARKQIKTETVIVENEIVRYVDRVVNAGCNLDDEWVRIFNASAGRSEAVAATTGHASVRGTSKNAAGGDDGRGTAGDQVTP